VYTSGGTYPVALPLAIGAGGPADPV
jgi:hypothetical protein